MKNFVLAAALTSALLSPAAVAGPAGAVSAPSEVHNAAPVASIQEEVFCAIVRFLKGGWAGRQTDCSF